MLSTSDAGSTATEAGVGAGNKSEGGEALSRSALASSNGEVVFANGTANGTCTAATAGSEESEAYATAATGSPPCSAGNGTRASRLSTLGVAAIGSSAIITSSG